MTTMDSPELIILDVGHGNCSILKDALEIGVVDCPDHNILGEFLEKVSANVISCIFVSHADVDHIAGISSLLFDDEITIQSIYVNSDPSKRGTKIWESFRRAIKKAKQRGVQVHTSLNSSVPGTVNVGQLQLQVLAPSPELTLGAVGGRDLCERPRTLNSNSLSAVIGLVHNDHRVAILAGDIDQIGLDDLLENIPNIEASVLVFPHHGGKPGNANPKNFALQLCSRVNPSLIIFSNTRGGFGNPREDIVEGVIAAATSAHILCTQLSSQCAPAIEGLEFSHLSDLPSKGCEKKNCCGGSISILVNGADTIKSMGFEPHKNFVGTLPQALCRKFLVDIKKEESD